MGRRWAIASALFLAIAGAAIASFIAIGRYLQRDRERCDRLHATILACQLVDSFLERNAYTTWPRSWIDLRSVPQREWGRFSWPRDADQIAGLVLIDFETNIGDVDAGSEDSFTAIRPKGEAAQTYVILGVRPLLRNVQAHRRPIMGESSMGNPVLRTNGLQSKGPR